MVIILSFWMNKTYIETSIQESYNKSRTFYFCNYTAATMSYDPGTYACSPSNVSTPTLSPEMQFGSENIISVAAYSCFFVIAACGNLTVFITLFRNRKIKSRVNLFILHLSVADLIVTFIMMPLEIGWHSTVSWRAGDIGCRILMFFRTFGLYLSSFVLVTISLDRYFAILHPLSLNDADRRGKMMLAFAWIFSAVASIPQSVIFHVERHPLHRWFQQCVTFNFFPNPSHELAYNIFHMIAMYGLPLLIITLAYILILREMSKKTRQGRVDDQRDIDPKKSRCLLRRSSIGVIERARVRTLKMTIVIVSVFALCWTPYFVLSAWWWFDRETAKNLDGRVQKGLFMFAVSNSCMNPIVYGIFTIKFKREFMRCCCCMRSNLRQMKNMAFTSVGNYVAWHGQHLHNGSPNGVPIPDKARKIYSPKLRRSLPGRFGTFSETSVTTSSGNDSETISNQNRSDSRANINNFMTVQFSTEDRNESKSV